MCVQNWILKQKKVVVEIPRNPSDLELIVKV